MYDSRQWSFIADMNSSGAVTISDVWLWVKWLFFYPGDMFIRYLVNEQPRIAQFFEVTYANYGGVLSGIISWIAWGLVVIVVDLIVGAIENLLSY